MPDILPQRFAPDIVSRDDRHEFGSVLTRDGRHLYIGVEHGDWTSIEQYDLHDGVWTAVGRIIGAPEFSANDPFLSPDESRLYFISKRGAGYDIGYIQQRGAGAWGEPVFESAPINSAANEYYISFTRRGDMVFASDRHASGRADFDIYLAKKTANGYRHPWRFPDTVNSKGYEADAFIDPDGRFLIFSSNREGSRRRGDLYVSFQVADGEWTGALPISAVNSDAHELCPFVTADGRTLFFTRAGDIYTVSASVIHRLRGQARAGAGHP